MPSPARIPSLTLLGVLAVACSVDPCAFNIDRHELAAGIDIPGLEPAYHCSCEGGVRTSYFDIDLADASFRSKHGDIERWGRRYGFVARPPGDLPALVGQARLPMELRDLPADRSLHVLEGGDEKRSWTFILDASTGALWAEMRDAGSASPEG